MNRFKNGPVIFHYFCNPAHSFNLKFQQQFSKQTSVFTARNRWKFNRGVQNLAAQFYSNIDAARE